MSLLDSSAAVADSPPLIYGLEHECRSLCSQYNENLPTRFFVGTQSLESSENQVHLLEYVEENDSLSKAVFKHQVGEIWHIISPSKRPNQIITCYSSHINLNRVENQCAIWQIPLDISVNLNEDDIQSLASLIKVENFNKDQLKLDENMGKLVRLKPDEENELIMMLETKLVHLDIETKSIVSFISNENKNTNRISKMTTFSWSPHFNGNVVGLVSNNNIYSKDLRAGVGSGGGSAWTIAQAHTQTVRDIDFNPNSQYYIASCGDDCEVKFWDIRQPSKPALKMLHHSHWLWAVRYNSFHDHLVLTASSDGNVNLLRAATIASQPYGHLIEDELDELDEEANIASLLNTKHKLTDGLILKFKDHEDSVYAIEWSPNDPWIFASLSYDGRFIINKVPESEKLFI